MVNDVVPAALNIEAQRFVRKLRRAVAIRNVERYTKHRWKLFFAETMILLGYIWGANAAGAASGR